MFGPNSQLVNNDQIVSGVSCGTSQTHRNAVNAGNCFVFEVHVFDTNDITNVVGFVSSCNYDRGLTFVQLSHVWGDLYIYI